MSVNAQNVLVGSPDQATTGAILSAPLGTLLPASARASLASAFLSSGYVGPDGVTLTPETSTTDVTDWGGNLVRRILENFNGTLAWAHLEINRESLANAFGEDNVKDTPASALHGNLLEVQIGAHEMPRKSWVFRMKDGKNRILIVVPDGQITERGEIVFQRSAAITLPVTLTTYPDAAGNNIYIYTDDGQVVAASPTAITVTGEGPLEVGDTLNLTATATYAGGASGDVSASATWTTSAPAVATVAGGVVTGVSAGTADIVAALGSTASTPVTVTVSAP